MSKVETKTTSEVISDTKTEKKVIHIHQHVHSNSPQHMKYRARQSHFDRFNESSAQDTFRGFYTLFWLAMAFYILRTGVAYYDDHGYWLGWQFGDMITRDGLVLLASDAVMVGSTFLAFPYVKLLQKGWLPYYQVGHYLQHVLQAIFLFMSISWGFHRQWFWVQSGFFLLHSLVMTMKTHSYVSYNGFLATRNLELKQLEKEKSALLKKTDDTTDDKNVAAKKKLSELEEAITDARADLVSAQGNVTYPSNVTLWNYMDYLLIPTLVYEMEYPRTDKIRWRYVLEKTMATFGTFYILYMTTEHYILPKIPETRNSLPRAFLELTFPFLVNYLLIFYIMFECICNAFAEVSMFADRNFYDDWWNSVTFDEFARKWNKPVHHFLLRHVYAYSISTYKLSKNNATFVTFLLSSLLHELVLIVVTKKFRMYLFAFQMLQLPLIAVGRLPAVKNNKVLGNAFFWFGMMFGPPFLCIAYLTT